MTRAFRFLGVIAACSGALYLALFTAAIGPTTRIQQQEELQVDQDSEAIRQNPLSFLRYYASVQGDAYLYFELGMRTAGRPLPQDRVAERMSTASAGAVAGTPQLAYRDFPSVYPPLAVIYFGALARVADGFDSFFLTLRWINLLAVIAIAALSYAAVRSRARPARVAYIAVSAIVVAALGPRWLCMYDALPALCVSAALHACCRRRPAMAGVALAAGTWLKIYPALLGPLMLVHLWRVRGWKGLTHFLAAGLLTTTLVVSPWLIKSPESLVSGALVQASRQYLTYDSALGSLFVIGRQIGLTEFEYDSELQSRVVTAPASRALAKLTIPSMLIAVIGLTVAYAAVLRRAVARDEDQSLASRLALGFLAVHVVILLTGTVFSPQYVLWLLPTVLPLVGRSAAIPAAAIACGLCIQLQFPIVEGLPVSLRELCLVPILAVRNLALLSLAWLSWPLRARSPV